MPKQAIFGPITKWNRPSFFWVESQIKALLRGWGGLRCLRNGGDGLFHVLAEELRDGLCHKAGLATAYGLPFVKTLFPEGGVAVGFLERELDGKACVLRGAFVDFLDGVDVPEEFEFGLGAAAVVDGGEESALLEVFGGECKNMKNRKIRPNGNTMSRNDASKCFERMMNRSWSVYRICIWNWN